MIKTTILLMAISGILLPISANAYEYTTAPQEAPPQNNKVHFQFMGPVEFQYSSTTTTYNLITNSSGVTKHNATHYTNCFSDLPGTWTLTFPTNIYMLQGATCVPYGKIIGVSITVPGQSGTAQTTVSNVIQALSSETPGTQHTVHIKVGAVLRSQGNNDTTLTTLPRMWTVPVTYWVGWDGMVTPFEPQVSCSWPTTVDIANPDTTPNTRTNNSQTITGTCNAAMTGSARITGQNSENNAAVYTDASGTTSATIRGCNTTTTGCAISGSTPTINVDTITNTTNHGGEYRHSFTAQMDVD